MVIARIRRNLGRFGRDRSGVSALEFALILPVMLVLYFGGNEFGNALTINRKVTHVTSTIADLVAQSKSLSNADIANIFDAAASIITPYAAGNLKMRVTLVTINNVGTATVVWSEAHNHTALAPNAVVTLPAGVKQNNTWVVMSEVEYPYQPMIGYTITGPVNLGQKFYIRPRQATGAIGRTS